MYKPTFYTYIVAIPVSELSRDAQELRQYEAPLLTVCSHQGLLVPDTRLKVRPDELFSNS